MKSEHEKIQQSEGRPESTDERTLGRTESERVRTESDRGGALSPLVSPFAVMRGLVAGMDRLLEGFGFEAGAPLAPVGPRLGGSGQTVLVPPLEVLEQDGQLVVHADVPGLEKHEIDVEVKNGQLFISGERTQSHEERRGEYYRSERSYGRFCRVVSLPPGAQPEQAKATFANGVLEVRIPVPERPQARRIEVQEGASHDTARNTAA